MLPARLKAQREQARHAAEPEVPAEREAQPEVPAAREAEAASPRACGG